MGDIRDYPQGLKEFPTELLNEEKAYKIHGQTLKRLNERGGLSYFEIYLNLSEQTTLDYDKGFDYYNWVLNKLKTLEVKE